MNLAVLLQLQGNTVLVHIGSGKHFTGESLDLNENVPRCFLIQIDPYASS